ncbi:hypothetical protein BRADI_5g15627v3 [Brachypodium distachyon]|uniref:F-box domain-containing protein n=1 Tax=Brachypodium distachyon TaxID=15368 RepID=I1IZN1_BRADI|nr:hypothetical protein BRADI_5g15627v3 [Brachypodium distachyon]
MATPPPKRPRHAHAPAAPQTTIADLVPEILLRVPPDNPGSLVRASSVCWRWRRLLTDQPFLRRYRAFYRTPPMLGFVVNLKEHFDGMARFVHSSFVPSAPDRAGMNVLDARHGRVLLHGVERRRGLVVWDPVTDEQRKIPGMPAYIDGFNAAVLCAAAGCDHLDCRCSPFMVAFVGFGGDGITFACTYSSETGNWSERVKIEEPASIDDRPSVLVGNTVYFACDPWIRSKIIAYDVVAQELSVIWPPPQHDDYSCTAIMKAEDGSLGFAGVQNARFFEDNSNASIHLWSMKPGLTDIRSRRSRESSGTRRCFAQVASGSHLRLSASRTASASFS